MTLDILSISHLCVTASYVFIPLQIVVALSKSEQRHNMPWRLMFCLFLFAWFFFLCGFAHFLLALGKGETLLFYVTQCGNAFVSTVTACYLIPLIPDMFALLDQAVDKLTEETKESKSKLFTFMAFLCHEIRNPLFAITSSAECLQDTSLQPDQLDEVSSISESSLLMLRLVNDVLDLSKLDAGKLELECVEFDLHAMVKRLGDNMARQVQRKHEGNVRLVTTMDTTTVPRVIIGDSVRMLQIVYNLLSNSGKFCNQGQIDLIVKATDANGNNMMTTSDEAKNCDPQVHTVTMSSDLPITMFSDEGANSKPSGGHSTTVTSDEDDDSGMDDDDDEQQQQMFSMALLGGHTGGGANSRSTPNAGRDIELGAGHPGSVVVDDGCSCNDGDCTSHGRTVILSIIVSDTGIGIPPERLKDIFQPYTQAKLSDFRQHGGTGLGLSIISSLTKTMGGTITVSSKEGDGATFHLRIPVIVPAHPTCLDDESMASSQVNGPNSLLECQRLPVFDDNLQSINTTNDMSSSSSSSAKHINHESLQKYPGESTQNLKPRENYNNHQHDPQPLPTKRSSFERRKDVDDSAQESAVRAKPPPPALPPFNLPDDECLVLVVDDNLVNRKILGKMLTTFNLKHRMACNGKEAVETLLASRNYPKHGQDTSRPLFGLVFMDVSMPVMDGNVAIQTVRKANISVPIVALSANVLSHERDKTIFLGANEFKTKPILRETMHSLCTKYMLTQHHG